MRKWILWSIVLSALLSAASFQTVSYPSTDSLKITADVYLQGNAEKPFILLFHRAGWSRGEYRDINRKPG